MKEERSSLSDKKESYVYDKDKNVNTYKRIQNHQFAYDEDLDMQTIDEYKQSIRSQIDDSVFDVTNLDVFIRSIFVTKPQEIIDELKDVQANKDSYELQEHKQLLIKQIQEMLDKSDGEVTNSIKEKQKQLKEVKNKLDNLDDNLDISGMTIGKIYNANWLRNHQQDAISYFNKLQTNLLLVKNEHTNKLSNHAQKQEDKIAKKIGRAHV